MLNRVKTRIQEMPRETKIALAGVAVGAVGTGIGVVIGHKLGIKLWPVTRHLSLTREQAQALMDDPGICCIFENAANRNTYHVHVLS